MTDGVYLNIETLALSIEKRKIHLITLSSLVKSTDRNEDYFNDNLFPEKERRAVRFKDDKPVVLVTARVHPGEAPSSFVMEGLVYFLLSDGKFFANLC